MDLPRDRLVSGKTSATREFQQQFERPIVDHYSVSLKVYRTQNLPSINVRVIGYNCGLCNMGGRIVITTCSGIPGIKTGETCCDVTELLHSFSFFPAKTIRRFFFPHFFFFYWRHLSHQATPNLSASASLCQSAHFLAICFAPYVSVLWVGN